MASFRLFSVVSNKQYNFYNKSMCKNVICIQYSAPGFKPTTSQTWVISYKHYTMAPDHALPDFLLNVF